MVLADQHRSNLASPDLADRFTGEADEIPRRGHGKFQISFQGPFGKLLAELIQDLVQVEPVVLLGQWQKWTHSCGLPGSGEHLLDGGLVHEDILTRLLHESPNGEAAVFDDVEREVQSIEKVPLLPGPTSPPASDRQPQKCEQSRHRQLGTVLADMLQQLFENGGHLGECFAVEASRDGIQTGFNSYGPLEDTVPTESLTIDDLELATRPLGASQLQAQLGFGTGSGIDADCQRLATSHQINRGSSGRVHRFLSKPDVQAVG